MAALTAALIAGGAALGSAAIASSASKKAVKAQTAAAQENNLLAERIRADNTALFQPDIQGGQQAQDLLADFIGLSGDGEASARALDTFLNSTGYQDTVSRGTEAIAGNRAAAGVLNSGATVKAATEYGQKTAMSYADRWLNLLSDRAGQGLTAKGAIAGVNTNYGSTVAGNNQNAADAASNGALQQGSIWGNALSGIAGAAGNYVGASSFSKGGAAGANPYGASALVPDQRPVQTNYPLLANPFANLSGVRF